jgi:murein tripeptide amidase MpaA
MNRSPLFRGLAAAVTAAMTTCSVSAIAADAVPEKWQTVAERSFFQATSSYDETVELLRRLVETSPAIHLESFGRSGMGRSLPLVVVSADRAFTPAAAAATGKPIVLIQSCVHAGEVDGKDASLLLLRDWALGRRELPRQTIVLFAPIYNVDGHEQVSPYNRPNQDGPAAGMGVRTTAAGIDLNRDHLRLASPEARAMISLFNTWRPHLHVDNHVTNGVDHGWVLTWAVAEAPQLDASLDAWIRDHLPPALAATA